MRKKKAFLNYLNLGALVLFIAACGALVVATTWAPKDATRAPASVPSYAPTAQPTP